MQDISQYIYQIGLPLLEKKGEHWNFRCIICGDSKKNPNKKRAWILNKGGIYFYYCHNCGNSLSFINFLKNYYYHIYLDYLKNIFINPKKLINEPKKFKQLEKKIIFPIDNISQILKLPEEHICKQYIKSRKIPFKYYNILYYCKNFQKEINKLFPEKFENYPEYDERILIPFFNKKNRISYIQGRTINGSYLRYITIELLSKEPKIYGLERIDISKPIFVVEGPFDSLFLDNALAMGCSSIDFNKLLGISNKSNFVFLFDLEPRNIQICKKIEKVVDKGFKICLIPHKYKKYGKDINQFIENGLMKDKVHKIIKNNIFQGFSAKIRLKLWRQC